MDKKELLKRWALAYTEPSLFYVPWRSKNQKPYGEYVTVQFDKQWYTRNSWQRIPVFAVYKVDLNAEQLIYSTAVYDDTNNLVRSGLSPYSFGIANKNGYAVDYSMNEYKYRLLLPTGTYKIKMLCSGSGIVITGEEWFFTIARNGENKSMLHQQQDFDYRFRTVNISPFVGYKYIGLSGDVKEIGKVNLNAPLKYVKERDVAVGGDIVIQDKNSMLYYQSLVRCSDDDIIKQNRYKTYYMGEICVNEYIYIEEGKGLSGETHLLKERGRKQIINNSRAVPFDSTEIYYIKNKDSLGVFSFLNEYYNYCPEFDYSFSVGDRFYQKTDFGAVAPIFDGSTNKRLVKSIFFSSDFLEDARYVNEHITSNIENATVYVNKPSQSITFYTGLIEVKHYSLDFNGTDLHNKTSYEVCIEAKDNTLLNRYNTFNDVVTTYQNAIAFAYENRYLKATQGYRDSLFISFEEFLSNIHTPSLKSKTVINQKLKFDYDDEMMIISYDTPEETIVYYDDTPTIKDLGVDWSGYDNYTDTNVWVGGNIYSSELEVYHPELIPKESEENGGET